MDIFEERHFNINRKLLMFIGQWPYHTKAKNIIRSCLMLALIILPAPQFISALTHYEEIDRLMFNIFSCLTAAVMFLKLVALTIAEDKMKELFENIASNWHMIRDEKEREIVVKYSVRARIITIFYAVSMFTVGTLMTLPPMFHKVLDVIIPLDKPRKPMYLMDGEFFVDREAYAVLLFFWDYFTIMSVTVTTIAVDTMYIAVSEHCCAMNAIISYRLQDLGLTSSGNFPRTDNESYNKITQVVHLHQKNLSFLYVTPSEKAKPITFIYFLSFISSMNDSYSLMFLFIMTVNLLIIPLNAIAIIANLDSGFLHLFPYGVLFGATALHFFCIFWPGQRIVDHNVNLCYDAYCNQWYTTASRTRKVLLIFMIKCYQPASLSAGGLFEINFEVFSRVMRTAISYITVLSSFR